MVHLQEKLFSDPSRTSTIQEASTERRTLGHLLQFKRAPILKNEKDIATVFLQESLRRISQEVGMSVSSTHKFMKKYLSLIPYKVRVVQHLFLLDYHKRKNFAAWFIIQSQLKSYFLHRKYIVLRRSSLPSESVCK